MHSPHRALYPSPPILLLLLVIFSLCYCPIPPVLRISVTGNAKIHLMGTSNSASRRLQELLLRGMIRGGERTERRKGRTMPELARSHRYCHSKVAAACCSTTLSESYPLSAFLLLRPRPDVTRCRMGSQSGSGWASTWVLSSLCTEISYTTKNFGCNLLP